MPPLLEPLPVDIDNKSPQVRPPSDVVFQDGLLAIRTNSSTLAEVLQAVADKIGASIEIPAGSGLDRIVEQTGPGPADEVLSRLLNGSPYDFVMLNSPESPHIPTRIVLLPRGSGAPLSSAPVQTVAAAPRQAEPELYGAGFSVEPGQEDDAPAETSVASAAPATPGNSDGTEIPGAVLDQMQKDRLRQRQLQMQQQQAATPTAAQ